MGYRRLLLWCAVFATAFGFIEGAVVVYLREICYPEGFAFPLREMAPGLLRTEIAREAATLVLLLGAAMLAERRPIRRFAVFAFCFGIWDITYYLALKAIVGWPPSLLTWDILFLIPLPWSGPVLAPVLVSIALIGAAVAILRTPGDATLFLRPVDWAVETAAGLVVVASFLWNVRDLGGPEEALLFPWWLFAIGCGGGALWILARALRR
ncbi:MAG TPA: hypothetical protein VFY93_04345 [Planctomycetota bacterium]|nr:hypothetical protein [Planctomycetota bacterium]